MADYSSPMASTSSYPLRSAMKRPSSPSSPSPEATMNSLDSSISSLPSALSQSTSSTVPSVAQTTSSTLVSTLTSAQSAASTLSPTSSTTAQIVNSPNFHPKVSFDTFENPDASMFSFTLQVESEGYRRIRSTRVFLCATSPDESGREALEWALESLVQDGDELIVYRGVEQEDLERDHDLVRDEARDLMRQIQEKIIEYDPDRKISLILEFISGRVTDTLDRLIALYRPDSVVVGTRGRRTWQGMGFGMGSVSQHCLSHSPVPTIVVRPERKLQKALEKRRADPKRGTHFDELVRERVQTQTPPQVPTPPSTGMSTPR